MCKLDSHFLITVEQKKKTHHPLRHLAAHSFPTCNACDSSPAVSTATTVTPFACWLLDESTHSSQTSPVLCNPVEHFLYSLLSVSFGDQDSLQSQNLGGQEFPQGTAGSDGNWSYACFHPSGFRPRYWEGLEWYPSSQNVTSNLALQLCLWLAVPVLSRAVGPMVTTVPAV